MEKWRGKIAVVTGASSGIGKAIALNLAQQGVIVFGLARRMDLLLELAEKAEPGIVHPIHCDVSNIDSIKHAFAEIDNNEGHVNILVNNAGTNWIGTFFNEKLAYDQMIRVINTNFTGAVICTREAYRLMQHDMGHCYIININSSLGHESAMYEMTTSNVFAATKHALRQHTDAIRVELEEDETMKNIRVSSIVVGACKTGIFEASSCDDAETPWAKFKHIQPEDVAAVVNYILSSDLDINITELTIKPVGEKF